MNAHQQLPTRRWVTSESGRILAEPVRLADSFGKRLVGLQFAPRMHSDEALWLQNCRSIHTACMRFSIDVFFLDAQFRVVSVRRNVPPWRIVKSESSEVQHVVEAQHLRASDSITKGLQTKFEMVGGLQS